MRDQWICEQFSTINVGDARLQKRAVDVAIGCAEHPEKSLAGRFDEWADLQGAYRFFSHPKITHQVLQQPHWDRVLERARFSEGTVLFIQDGSELLFNSHPWTHGLGPTADSNGNGLMFHSCLVAKYHESEETEILGLGYQEAWVRPEEKSARDPKESVSPDATRIFDRSNSGDDLQSISGCEETGWVFSGSLGRNEGFIQIYGMALMGTALPVYDC
jgi:hypothetical protein